MRKQKHYKNVLYCKIHLYNVYMTKNNAQRANTN